MPKMIIDGKDVKQVTLQEGEDGKPDTCTIQVPSGDSLIVYRVAGEIESMVVATSERKHIHECH
jgi:hypothetical protein